MKWNKSPHARRHFTTTEGCSFTCEAHFTCRKANFTIISYVLTCRLGRGWTVATGDQPPSGYEPRAHRWKVVGTNLPKTRRNSVVQKNNWVSLVAGAGFEPTTFGLWARRATRLLPSRDINFKLAEEKGFEPLRRSPDLLVFKTSPFNRTWVFLHFFKRNLIIA